jgi:HSP20 family molecular chaperone IbpA
LLDLSVERVFNRRMDSHQDVVDATTKTGMVMHPQTVPVNVYESPAALVIVAPLPAVTAEDVVVEVHASTVRFYADLRSAPPREYLVHEWEYGGFEREIDLPQGFGSEVEASLANGQLAIRVMRGEFVRELSIAPDPH